MRELFSVFSLALLFVSLVFGQANVNIPITVSDGISTKNGLAIGVDTAATNGIDEQLGESDLPPFPPAGIFEARFDLSPYTGQPLSSYKDYRNAPSLPFIGVVEYKLIWQLSAGAGTFAIGYSIPPEVTIDIKDPLGGILFDSGILSDSGSYSVPTPFLSLSAVIITMVTKFQLTVNIANGWNLVSIPGLHPVNQNVITWWPGQDPLGRVYKFDWGYQPVTVATPTEGYWMKHLGNQTYNTGDEWPASGILIVPHTLINVAQGWNMFGGFEDTVAAVALTTTPPGQMIFPIYKFIPGTGYAAATHITPGYGYWVKVLSACQLNIPNLMAKNTPVEVEYFKDDWGRITVTDATGNSYTLYAVKGEVDLNQYELPPLPPEGTFDIRYGTGRIAEDLSKHIQSIEMNGINYPITISVENIKIKLQDETAKIINTELEPDKVISIGNVKNNKLLIISGEFLVPIEYKLEQNYPNPFNPNTTIKFSIPKDVQVNLSVYNILGEKVKELKNEVIKPGYYEIEFYASTLVSGVYLYRIKAGDFVQTKKMILLK